MTDQPPASPAAEMLAAFDTLPLDAVEEASGELHRRISAALRVIGEERADAGRYETGDEAPRRLVAAYAAQHELAILALAAAAAGVTAFPHRLDRHPALVGALAYGAPRLGDLLTRLEQDRRTLAALARHEESRLDTVHPGPWGATSLRRVLTTVTLVEGARCAHQLEAVAAALLGATEEGEA